MSKLFNSSCHSGGGSRSGWNRGGRGIGRGGKIALSKMVEEENDKVDKHDDKEFDKEQNKVGENK